MFHFRFVSGKTYRHPFVIIWGRTQLLLLKKSLIRTEIAFLVIIPIKLFFYVVGTFQDNDNKTKRKSLLLHGDSGLNLEQKTVTYDFNFAGSSNSGEPT